MSRGIGSLFILLLIQPWGLALEWYQLSFVSLGLAVVWYFMAFRAKRDASPHSGAASRPK